MADIKILLLPGLDGSGFYFTELQNALARDHPCELLSYPKDLHDYGDLCAWAADRLDFDSEYVIVAESFGGPLGILLTEVLEEQTKGLVLCATFCTPPLPPAILTLAAWLYPQFIRFNWMAHFLNFFLCNGKALEMAQKLHRVLMTSPDKTIRRRIRNLRNIDMRPASAALTLPCLVINAKHDRLVWFSRFSHLANARILTIDGPHGLAGLNTTAVAEAISDFIKAKI